MKTKNLFLMFPILLISSAVVSENEDEIDTEGKFYTKEHALQYYMDKNNHPDNIFQIEKSDMKILDIDDRGGYDLFIVNANFCGNLYGCGGGVFLCQGQKQDCSDGYFCEANKDPFYELKIKTEGHKLKCK